MNHYQFQDCSFFPEENKFEGPKGVVEVRNQVAVLFQFLIDKQDTVTHAEIMEHLWPDTHVKESAVAQIILELRTALEEIGSQRTAITTIPRQGYQWKEQGNWVEPASPQMQLNPKLLLVPILVGLLFLAAWWLSQPKQPPEQFSIALAPFENQTGQADYAWLELGLPDVLGQLLSESGNRVMPMANVIKAMEDMDMDQSNNQNWEKLQNSLGVELLIQTKIFLQEDRFRIKFHFREKDRVTEWQTVVSRPWDVAPALSEGILKKIKIQYDFPTDSEIMALDEFSSEALAQGIHAFNGKDYDQAQPFFEIIRNRHPNFAIANFYLAQCALKLSDYDTCKSLCEGLLENPDLSQNHRRLAQYVLAELTYNLRQFEEARHSIQELLQDLKPQEDPNWAIKVYWLMGSLDRATGNKQEAKSWYQKALELARSHKNLSAEAHSLWYICALNPYDQKNLPNLQKTLDLANAAGNNLLSAKTMNAIAHLYDGQGRFQEARELFENALKLRRQLKDQRGIALGLLYLGHSESRFDAKKAQEYFESSLELFQKIQDTFNIINVYIYMAHSSNMQFEHDQAISYLEKAMDVARKAEDYDAFHYIRFNQVETELRRKNIPKAKQYVAEMASEENLPSYKLVPILALEGICLFLEGKIEESVQKMDQARNLEGNGWAPGHEVYYDLIVESQIQGVQKTLPIHEDPSRWLFD